MSSEILHVCMIDMPDPNLHPSSLNWNFAIMTDHDYSTKIIMSKETFFMFFDDLASCKMFPKIDARTAAYYKFCGQHC